MKGEEVIEILSVERACICRQARGDCKHKCTSCDFAIAGDKLLEAVDKAIEVLIYVEAHKKHKSK